MTPYTRDEVAAHKPQHDYAITPTCFPIGGEWRETVLVSATDPRGERTPIAAVYMHECGRVTMRNAEHASLGGEALQYLLGVIADFENIIEAWRNE